MGKRHISLLVAVIIGIALFQFFDLGFYLTLENIKQQQFALQQYYAQHTLLTLLVFSLIFTAYAALPVPGLILLTLLSAAVFGFLPAFLITSFGTAIGGSLAFLIARHTLRKPLESHFPKQFAVINGGVEKEGAYYLFSIRLVPLFPFFMVNSLMGLTHLSLRHFYIATQLGMLASTAVFANAGTQLSQISSVNSLFTPQLIGSFMLMGIVPLVCKKILNQIKLQRLPVDP